MDQFFEENRATEELLRTEAEKAFNAVADGINRPTLRSQSQPESGLKQGAAARQFLILPSPS